MVMGDRIKTAAEQALRAARPGPGKVTDHHRAENPGEADEAAVHPQGAEKSTDPANDVLDY